MYGFLFEKVIFPLYDSFKKNGKKHVFYHTYSSQNKLKHEEILAIQNTSLNRLIQHAYQNVPYYRKLIDSLNLLPTDFTEADDLNKLPILTKEIIKANYVDLIAVNYKGQTKSKTTGGSTGVPLKFEIDHEITERRYAIMQRGYEWGGYKVGRDKALYLWGATLGKVSKKQQFKEWLHHRFYNRIMVSTFNLNINNLNVFINTINKTKPDVIVAYTSPVFTIAEYILSQGISVYSPRVILTGAEPLYDYQKEIIQKAFNTTVINTFGCRECMLMGSEHHDNNRMYINDDHLILESVDEAGKSGWNREGELTITDLFNYGMPLIRYQNGDLVTLDKHDSADILPFNKIQKISGRVLDQIRTVNGDIIPGELFPHLLKDFDAIAGFQIIQKKLDAIEFNYVPSDVFDKSQLVIIKNMIDDVTKGVLSINFNQVNALVQTTSGKRRITISEL